MRENIALQEEVQLLSNRIRVFEYTQAHTTSKAKGLHNGEFSIVIIFGGRLLPRKHNDSGSHHNGEYADEEQEEEKHISQAW